MIEYKYDEELWYCKRRVLYHHIQGDYKHSIVYFVVANQGEVNKFKNHPDFFSSISKNVYFRVLTHELSRHSPAYTNREAAFMLTKEE